MHLLRSTPSGARREEAPRPNPASPNSDGNFQDFQVLLRKGSKQQTRTLSVRHSLGLFSLR